MAQSKLTKCPYTLKPVTELSETSQEHIILDALGGPDAYSVTACRSANSQLGAQIDAAFLADPLVAQFRNKIGVMSRSGIASWNVAGKTVQGNRPVEVTFPHQGPVTIYHQKPVEKMEQGKGYQIIAPPVQANKILQEMTKNLAKKGLGASVTSSSQNQTQEVHLSMTVNFTVLRAGLMKIAYLACCEFLGDNFLNDPLNSEWQKIIRTMNESEAKAVKIRGRCFDDATNCANYLLPSLSEQEHGIAIVNLRQCGPIVAVRLFGSTLLTAVVSASETDNYGLQEGDGMLLICDSKTRTIKKEQWINHLLRMSRD